MAAHDSGGEAARRGRHQLGDFDDVAPNTVFVLLRQDVDSFFERSALAEALRYVPRTEVVDLASYDTGASDRALRRRLEGYLHGHDEQLQAFLLARLVPAVCQFLQEELTSTAHGTIEPGASSRC